MPPPPTSLHPSTHHLNHDSHLLLFRTRLKSSTEQLSGCSPEESHLASLLIGTPSTPAGTPRGIRDDSSDTLSETDSQKSSRTRRKLPHLPPDQEAVPLSAHKKLFGQNTQERVRWAREATEDVLYFTFSFHLDTHSLFRRYVHIRHNCRQLVSFLNIVCCSCCYHHLLLLLVGCNVSIEFI